MKETIGYTGGAREGLCCLDTVLALKCNFKVYLWMILEVLTVDIKYLRFFYFLSLISHAKINHIEF